MITDSTDATVTPPAAQYGLAESGLGILEVVKAKYGEFVPVGMVVKLLGSEHGLPVVNDGVAATNVAVEIRKARESALRDG